MRCSAVASDISGIRTVTQRFAFFSNHTARYFFAGGKCGICGEPYDRAIKLFEKGGRMYTGKIVQIYNQGQEIDVKVKV